MGSVGCCCSGEIDGDLSKVQRLSLSRGERDGSIVGSEVVDDVGGHEGVSGCMRYLGMVVGSTEIGHVVVGKVVVGEDLVPTLIDLQRKSGVNGSLGRPLGDVGYQFGEIGVDRGPNPTHCAFVNKSIHLFAP